MSLIDQKNKGELQAIARSLFIELDEGATVKDIRAKLHEEKVSDEDIENLEVVPEVDPNAPIATTVDQGIVTSTSLQEEAAAAAPAPFVAPATVEEVAVSDTVLLKYERQNATFEILTYRFTREHPFLLVTKNDADYIVRNIPGFRPALQSEAEEFYS